MTIQGSTAVTTTKTVDFAPGGDLNDNGIVDEGDVLRYTVTAANNSGSDLNNFVFTDTIDANTTISGTVNSSPIAVDDAVTAVVGQTTDIPEPGLFANKGFGADYLGAPLAVLLSFGGTDLGGANETDNNAGDIVPIPTYGGTITVNTDGSVTISNPTSPGTFTFDYLIDNGVASSVATVTVTLTQAPIAQPDAYAFSPTVDQNVGAGTGLFVDNGSGPVTDAFWVDLYVNPATVPTQPNQLWNIGTGSEGGAVWGLEAANGAQPIALGDSRTLTIGGAYYFGGSSDLTAVTGGETIYVQVDSYGAGPQLIGNVPEMHELTGQPYNNISGPQTLPPVFTPSTTSVNSLSR